LVLLAGRIHWHEAALDALSARRPVQDQATFYGARSQALANLLASATWNFYLDE
jgi:hypothetical protein